MSERDQPQSEELRSLRQEMARLRREMAGLPLAVADQMEAGLHPLVAVKSSADELLKSNQNLAEELKSGQHEMQTLAWHLAQPRRKTFLGWVAEEWKWVGVAVELGVVAGIGVAVLLIRGLT